MTSQIAEDSKDDVSMSQAVDSTLPTHLEEKAFETFDSLVDEGEIIYDGCAPQILEDRGSKFLTYLSPWLLRKPIMAADAPNRTGKAPGPFTNPDPRYILSYVGPHHTLILNKFPVVRPMLLLLTKQFAPQTDDLDDTDLTAAWGVLDQLNKSSFSSNKYIMIYNCGMQAGSSQGHKHMQIWPLPIYEAADGSDHTFELFPDKVQPTTEVVDNIPGTLHRHYVIPFPRGASARDMLDAYPRVLKALKHCLDTYGGRSRAYNVALTQDWICLIPRRSSGGKKRTGANAAGVLGLIWLTTKAEQDVWTRHGPAEFMKYLGIPREGEGSAYDEEDDQYDRY